MAAAAPASGNIALAIFINDDESVGEFAAVNQNTGEVQAQGTGAAELAGFARQAIRTNTKVTTLGGLDAFKRAFQAQAEAEPAIRQLAKQHADAAYDFLVDNGYPLAWDALFPDIELPDAASDAAGLLARWIQEAERTGVIARRTKAGKTSHWPLVAIVNGTPRFRTVNEARTTFEQDPPDQSWMSEGAPDITQETHWLQI